MPDFARGFRLYTRGGLLDGAEFPCGRAVDLDDAEYSLASAAATLEDLLKGYPHARVEWPDDTP